MGYQLVQIVTLLTVIAFGALRKVRGECSSDDLEGLMAFKNGIQMDTSGRLAKWVGRNCCEWEGVVCDNATTRVTQILLPGLNEKDFVQTQMVGQLSPSMTLLTSLEILDLGGLVGLSGAIPLTIGLQMFGKPPMLCGSGPVKLLP